MPFLVVFTWIALGSLSETQGRTWWRLPATIEALQDVTAQSGDAAPQQRGILYIGSAKSFVLDNGQGPFDKGQCRIRFDKTEFNVSSCPWLDGFEDHQTDIFKVVSGRSLR